MKTLLPALGALLLLPQLAHAQTRTSWQRHEGVGVSPTNPYDIARTLTGCPGGVAPSHGNICLYADAVLPGATDAGWLPAPNPDTIGFSVPSRLPGGSCYRQADFNYFQTFVNVPDDVNVTTFSIDFSGMDDGSRVTIFNSANPGGLVIPGSYVYLGGSGTTNLAPYVVSGEINRVVVTQVDDCPVGNNLQSARVTLNGQTVVRPPCFAEGGDSDNDSVCDNSDNCVAIANPDQTNGDGDAFGDVCDTCPASFGDQADGCCLDGRGPNGLACELCPEGTAGVGGTCEACPAGTVNPFPGATTCVSPECGYEPSADQTAAVACPPGFFNDDGGACEACPSGSFSAAEGACSCDVCPPGREVNATQTGCDVCPAGTASDDGLSCDACPADTVAAAGAAACTPLTCGFEPAPDQSVAWACPPGFFNDDGGTCDACPAGTYTGDFGACACDVCPPGTIPGVTQMACEACPPGYDAAPGDATCQLVDIDLDGVPDLDDNCVTIANTDQSDRDGDGIGDVCDACADDAANDADADGFCADVDNCGTIANDQADADADGAGDACDVCPADPDDDLDGDGVCGDLDNCPDVANGDTIGQSKIFINNDEWTLSDTGYNNAPIGTPIYVENLTDWFTGGQPGNFLAYSNNFGLTGTRLRNQMAALGHTYTVSTSGPLTLARMQQYDAIFLGGFYTGFSQADLIAYIQQGGNVYIAAGTGAGGPVAEANAWNTFLGSFGLSLAPSYNGVGGVYNPSTIPHPVFAGVTQLYANNGNTVLPGATPSADTVIFTNAGGVGLFGVYDAAIDGNDGQVDSDGDGLGDACDACPTDGDKDDPGVCGCGVADTDGDGDGLYVCEETCDADPDKFEPGVCGCGTPDDDTDGDGAADCVDTCPFDANDDSDGDGSCDSDDPCPTYVGDDEDGDGVCGDVDNCTFVANDQTDTDGDAAGDACDVCPLDALNDADADGFCADVDNCPVVTNDQTDTDGDAAGDACDVCPLDALDDADRDGVCADSDNCPTIANDQADSDGDAAGDACDICPLDPFDDADADTVCGDTDVCPGGDDRIDGDGDGAPDFCDVCPIDANDDSDGDGSCDSADLCEGDDRTGDSDLDGTCDDLDPCDFDAEDDADNDGICGDLDACPGTRLPETVQGGSLGTNRFADTDGDGVFNTVLPRGRGPQRSYTMESTAGCSCTQIIAACGVGQGHSKFGCSISVMDDWTDGDTNRDGDRCDTH